MRGCGTQDIPRFGALRRDNTPSPAECSWMINSTMLLLELYEEEGSCPRLGLLLLSGTAVWWLVLCFCFLLFVFVRRIMMPIRWCDGWMLSPCGHGFIGGFIDQPTQGYNGNMSSRWVRTVGARDSELGPACGLVVRRVPLGGGPACLGGLCAVLSIIRAWPSRVVYSALRQAAAC